MRERIARAASAAALGTLVALAIVFARAQNPLEAEQLERERTPAGIAAEAGATAPLAGVPPTQTADSARGRALFEEQGCTGCHSAAGIGSPRIPLDGIGSRRTRAALRAWTIGAEALADSLAPSTLRRKQAYGRLPAADLNALVAFLASLRGGS